MKKIKNNNIHVRLDDETHAAIMAYAANNNTSVSKLIRGFINTLLGKKA